ncbi:MAG: PilZ domain-containing protein, partial [Elusimicrobiota bacterium]
EKVYDVTKPIEIMGARWGEIRIGFLANPLDEKVSLVRSYILCFGFFIIAAVIVYILFFPNTITVPIMRMTSRGLVGEEQRRFTRALTNIVVECSINHNPPVICRMTDISISGMKLIYPDNVIIQKGDKVELGFALLVEEMNSKQKPLHHAHMQNYSIKGTVKWLSSGQERACGIEFEAVNLFDRMKLADFINATKSTHETWVREKLDALPDNSPKH